MKYRVLLLGLGFWGSRWLTRILDSDRVELAGICGGTKSLSETLKQYPAIPGEIAFTDYREAIEKVPADVMINVLPGALHCEADLLAMRKEMHILSEKPLTLTMEEAQRLLEEKERHPGLLFMVSQNYRWRPHNQTIRRALQEGKIGRLERILLEFRRQEDLQGYRKNLRLPLLQDMAIHHFDLIRFFTESDFDRLLFESSRPSWSQYSGASDANGLIRMKNGVSVTYTGTWAARGNESSWDGNLTFTGEKGCITLNADDQVVFYPHTKDATVVLEASRQKGEILEPVFMEKTEGDYAFALYLDCLDGGIIPETTLEDNVRSLEMVCAAISSADNEVWVKAGDSL